MNGCSLLRRERNIQGRGNNEQWLCGKLQKCSLSRNIIKRPLKEAVQKLGGAGKKVKAGRKVRELEAQLQGKEVAVG